MKYFKEVCLVIFLCMCGYSLYQLNAINKGLAKIDLQLYSVDKSIGDIDIPEQYDGRVNFKKKCIKEILPIEKTTSTTKETEAFFNKTETIYKEHLQKTNQPIPKEISTATSVQYYADSVVLKVCNAYYSTKLDRLKEAINIAKSRYENLKATEEFFNFIDEYEDYQKFKEEYFTHVRVEVMSEYGSRIGRAMIGAD